MLVEKSRNFMKELQLFSDGGVYSSLRRGWKIFMATPFWDLKNSSNGGAKCTAVTR